MRRSASFHPTTCMRAGSTISTGTARSRTERHVTQLDECRCPKAKDAGSSPAVTTNKEWRTERVIGADLKTDGAGNGMGIKTSAIRHCGRLTGQAHRHRLESGWHLYGCAIRVRSLPPPWTVNAASAAPRSKRDGCRKALGIKTSAVHQFC